MGRLRFGSWSCLVMAVSVFLFLPACGGHKPAGTSGTPVRISLNPSVSYSIQAGSTLLLSASAVNSSNNSLRLTYTYQSSNTSAIDISPSGFACAGTWNAPLYNQCTPGSGQAEVTATALGSTSAPTLFFVHPAIDNIQISVIPPVNSPPPACPNQQTLPAACTIAFNPNAAQYCLSQNQVQTLQAKSYSQGVDISAEVGPITWSEANGGVVAVTPIIPTATNGISVATNQATISSGTPGQTALIASASGANSQPYYVETCNVQCISLNLGANNIQSTVTNFVAAKGTPETITATAVDVQGCIVPKPPLTWISSEPASIAAGSGSSTCSGATCTVSTPQPGAAAITASCSPPVCNVGFPLNPAGLPAPYIPQPVYPVTAISGIVTGATVSTNVLASSQDCYSDNQCGVGIYNVSTATNLSGAAMIVPSEPNSLLFDPAGDKAYMGSEFGAAAINPADFGTSTNPYTYFPAAGTPLGLVTGKILATSPNGNFAVFSDTIDTPNQVYLVASGSSVASTPLNVNAATAAAFSPDGLKVFILGNGGTTLYVYSPLQTLQALPPNPLPTPANSIVFNSTGSFALLDGGSSAGNLLIYNTCDNSSVSLSAGTITATPDFLKMVPGGNVPIDSTFGGTFIPLLQTQGLDFFFGVDSTGIDVIATNISQPVPAGTPATTQLCPQLVTLAQVQPPTTPPTYFPPYHINLGQGTFNPINFFVAPSANMAYVVTSDVGVLVYNFGTETTTAIRLINNATPIAADITADGTLIYVAGSDGLLHQLNTTLNADEFQTSFAPLPDSSNDFCDNGPNCMLNLVAVKP